jgi:hypothetical protein
MDDPRAEQVRLDARLDSCREKNAAVAWPLPIDNRLDELVELAREAGESTTRKELAAAIVLAAAADPDVLSEILHTYRRATTRDALVTVVDEANVVSIHRHKPGPRPRRTAPE